MNNLKLALTIEEASAYTGIGRNTIRQLIGWGKLPVLLVGRKIIIRRDALESFILLNEGRNLKEKAEVRAPSGN